MKLSFAALEELAARVRAGGFVVDREPLREQYPSAYAESPALGALVAEAWTQLRVEPWQSALDRAFVTGPIALAGETAVALPSLETAVALEPNDARRQALWDLACTRANEHFREGRDAVSALRSTAESLGLADKRALLERLGLAGLAGLCDPVLAATDGVFDELDPWALREAGLHERVILARRRELPWDARLRTLSQPRASGHVPLGDRAGASARWIQRIGLERALSSVIDHTEMASTRARGVTVRCEREGERVVLSGEADPTVFGGARLTGAFGEALALARPSHEPSPSARAGIDRVHVQAIGWLAANLWLSHGFVSRELGVDPARASLVNRAALHGALFRLRLAAAEAPYVRDALEGAPELTVRLRDRTVRAVFGAFAPSWTVHVAARALARRAEASVTGAVIEAVLHEDLRERCDEDWFRNPRAGDELALAMDSLRREGATPWLRARLSVQEKEPDSLAVERACAALKRRVSESFERVTR